MTATATQVAHYAALAAEAAALTMGTGHSTRTVAGCECTVTQRVSTLDPTRMLTTHVVRIGVHVITAGTSSSAASLAGDQARRAWADCVDTATNVRAVIREAERAARTEGIGIARRAMGDPA